MNDDRQNAAEHLKLVQGVVARMASASAQMKTWAVLLVAAALVFSGLSDNTHWLIGLGGCIPVIAFWSMDARYLHLERCYIKLYQAVLDGKAIRPFDLDYRPFVNSVGSVWNVAWSWSVFRFYGALLAVNLAFFVFLLLFGTH